ncbi:MAG: hypothetical protein ACTSPV_03865 [Candidatus Hodarchaeales archaeon]
MKSQTNKVWKNVLLPELSDHVSLSLKELRRERPRLWDRPWQSVHVDELQGFVLSNYLHRVSLTKIGRDLRISPGELAAIRDHPDWPIKVRTLIKLYTMVLVDEFGALGLYEG